jgi:phospho-N-acetylmuramoyl-pentapeptide-transferase
MLYYIFKYLEESHQFPGASLFGFLTFRAAVAIIMSLLISTIFGKRIISFLQKQQVGEVIRDLGLEGQKEKAGTLYYFIDNYNLMDGSNWVFR